AFSWSAGQTCNRVSGAVDAVARNAIPVPPPVPLVVETPLQLLLRSGIGPIEVRRDLLCGLLAGIRETVKDAHEHDVIVLLLLLLVGARVPIDSPVVAPADFGERRHGFV